MSNKTDYKRIKEKLKKENAVLFNENIVLRGIIKMAKGYMSEAKKKTFINKIKKEYSK